MTSHWGRPTRDPKSYKFTVRLDDECKNILELYSRQESVSQMEAARRGIRRLKPDLRYRNFDYKQYHEQLSEKTSGKSYGEPLCKNSSYKNFLYRDSKHDKCNKCDKRDICDKRDNYSNFSRENSNEKLNLKVRVEDMKSAGKNRDEARMVQERNLNDDGREPGNAERT